MRTTTRDIFIVMERLSGRTLGTSWPTDRSTRPACGRWPTRCSARSVRRTREGLVHRDVKPGNILLTDDGTFKVGDFGIATSLDAGETTTRVPLGTPAYTAPERLRGLGATERSDLYCAGRGAVRSGRRYAPVHRRRRESRWPRPSSSGTHSRSARAAPRPLARVRRHGRARARHRPRRSVRRRRRDAGCARRAAERHGVHGAGRGARCRSARRRPTPPSLPPPARPAPVAAPGRHRPRRLGTTDA